MTQRYSWTPPELFEEYRLVSRLGRGGMGEVFVAQDTVLDRQVAVKFISEVSPDPVARERFLVEARAIARLQHPNILTIYRIGELEGRPYIVSEYLRGTSLDNVPTPVPWKRALELGIGIARGLAAAHRRGVLHRDIKPANVILTDDGVVKLLDFGLAKLVEPGGATRELEVLSTPPPRVVEIVPPSVPEGLDDTRPVVMGAVQEGPRTQLTRHGVVMGTPDYMPPEAFRAEPATRRSDIYSLGALLYELCVGYTPNSGEDVQVLIRRHGRDAQPMRDLVPSVDVQFAAVVDRCLKRDPVERFGSGDELREALERLHPATGVHAGILDGNPYRGLQPFRTVHAPVFFGRDAETRTIVDRLRAQPFVLVSGDSGIGKTSLCEAGVIAKVTEGSLGEGRSWSVVRLVPGRRPVQSLATALAGSLLGGSADSLAAMIAQSPVEIVRDCSRLLGDKSGMLVFVDALEEMFVSAQATEASAVWDVLAGFAAGVPGVRLLAAIRSDFLTRLVGVPRIGDEVMLGLHILRAPSPDGLREAITGPALASGFTFESEALVDELVESASHTEGGLPLVQFALAALWDARDEGLKQITRAALHSIGGVEGAVARHADTVLYGLPAAQRPIARRLLTALVSADGTRAERSIKELASDEDTHAVLAALVRGRVVAARDSAEGTVYALAHDSFLTGWATLRGWLDQDAVLRAVRQRVQAATAEWERLSRSREALWSERRVSEAELLLAADIAPAERAFLEASTAAVRRRRIGRRLLIVGVPLLLALALGTTELASRYTAARSFTVRFDQARAAVGRARESARRLPAERAAALALFDSSKRAAAEPAWARVRDLERNASSSYARASGLLERAVLADPARADARSLLGAVLQERAELARDSGSTAAADELEQRLAAYDPERAKRLREASGARVSVTSTPPGARVGVERFVESRDGPPRWARQRDLGTTPIAGSALPPGSYVLLASVAGRPSVRLALDARSSQSSEIALDLPRAVPEGMIYVPAGTFLVGTGADERARRLWLDAVPLHPVRVGAYLISTTETTFASWIEYLAALGPEQRARHTPSTGRPGEPILALRSDAQWGLTLRIEGRTYQAAAGENVTYRSRSDRAVQDWRRFPVTGIDLDDARSFAAWLAQSGRLPGARLCSENEWERAARGADDRDFPHGHAMGPADANHAGSAPAEPGPDAVGSFPRSRSPYGLEDMAGNAREWTSQGVSRGGSFLSSAGELVIPRREVLPPTTRSVTLGLRICADAR